MMRRGQMRGFTLMELLVATTLLALLSLTVLLGMRIGFRAWEKAERRLAEEAEEAAVEEYLGRALASTVAYKAMPAEEKPPREFVPFQGTSQGARWLSTYSTGWQERSGLVLVECFVAGEGNHGRLVVEQFPVRGDANLARGMLAGVEVDPESGRTRVVYQPFDVDSGAPESSARTLVADVPRARFEFLKVTPRESSWQDTWDGARESQLPAAVRLIVESADGERRWIVPIHSEVLTP